MNQSVIAITILALTILLNFTSCGKDQKEPKLPPVFKSSIPENGATEVALNTEIVVLFDEVITLAPNHGITINDQPADVEVSFTKLIFTATLEGATTYTINIPVGSVINTLDVPLPDPVQFSFTTKALYIPSSNGLQFVAQMGTGWNLGNTLDTKHKDKTRWGNPETTKEMIDAVKAKGFKTLRVPVTWQYNMGAAPDYTIEQTFLNRVEEIVNYGLDNDMYVIVNIHHDEEWLKPTYAKVDIAKDQLSKVWTQIANQFKTYDNHLVFEAFNETRLKGSAEEWKGGTAEGRDCINQFNETAVKAIRTTGGKNTDRYIMLSTYAASTSPVALEGLVLPVSTNLIVSLHSYFPYKFALAETGFDTEWGSESDRQALDAELDKIASKFIDNEIPVVMGEWANLNRDNLTERVEHASYYATGCIERGICPVWWDNGNADHFGLLNRNTKQWVYPGIADALVNAAKK